MKIGIMTLVALALFATARLIAAPDCMDTSSYLKDKIDYKNLRLVACNHNCYKDPAARIIDKQGKCTVCGHYHIPRPWDIVRSENPATMPAPAVTKTQHGSLARLFGHYSLTR